MNLFAVTGVEIGLVLAVVGGVLLVFTTAGRRILSAVGVQWGKAGRWAKKQDPLAVYQQRVDEGTEKIAKARASLGQFAGEVRSSTRAAQDAQAEVTRLTNRIETAMAAGDPNKTAEGYALQLADAEKKLAKANEKLGRDTDRFNNASSSIEEGKRQVEQARQECRELGMELEHSKREREMNEFAAGFDPNSFMGDNSLADAREQLQKQIDENRGMGDADAALNKQRAAEAKDRELERQARAADVLKRFQKPQA